MASASGTKPSRIEMRELRRRPREQGLRAIKIPDVRSPAFRAEAHRQSAAIAASAQSREDQAFIDTLSGWSDE